MKKQSNLIKIAITGMLCAIGILIPTFFPKIVIGPASYTLASHVAIFIAMFISPGIACAVTLGTTLGFLISGLPIVITLRALSHIVYAMAGALYLKKFSLSKKAVLPFGITASIVHALLEVVVVSFFYFGNRLSAANYEKGYLYSVLLLIGGGGFIHSMIDYYISVFVWKLVSKTIKIPVSVK